MEFAKQFQIFFCYVQHWDLGDNFYVYYLAQVKPILCWIITAVIAWPLKIFISIEELPSRWHSLCRGHKGGLLANYFWLKTCNLENCINILCFCINIKTVVMFFFITPRLSYQSYSCMLLGITQYCLTRRLNIFSSFFLKKA